MADRRFTRQLATIVAMDAVGFSRLMGIDDEAALTAFEERRDIIVERCGAFGGRTFGDAGDSIMAEFGNPVEALLATFDLLERIAALDAPLEHEMRMPFRAGINTGNVITRNGRLYGDDVNIAARIQEFAPRNGLVLSGTTWHHVKDKAAAEFTDLGEFLLKNIALPVRVLIAARARPAAAPAAAEDLRAAARREAPPLRPAAARPIAAPPSAGGPPTIAVLPFQSHGEGDLAYMAEGMAEDIIHGLSSMRWLSVIAKGSSFQFRDESLGTRLIGHALGARYVVGGSLAPADGRVRLGAALTDASNGRLVWSRRFERPLSDLFALQNEIGSEIVSMLEKEVDRAEQARTFQVPWENLETWQLVLRGRWHMGRLTREDTQLALEFFDKAYREDPNSTAVLNELAWWYFWRAWLRFGDSDDLDKVSGFARRALLMDSLDARPHAHLGAVEIMRGRPHLAVAHLEEALHLNPSFAFARSAMGSARMLLGDATGAIPHFLDAERLSPFDLYAFHNLGELAAACFFVGDFAAAARAADRALDLSPGYFYARFLKVAALARAGRREEAAGERAAFEARHPDFCIERIRWIPFADGTANQALIDGFDAVPRPPTPANSDAPQAERDGLHIRFAQ